MEMFVLSLAVADTSFMIMLLAARELTAHPVKHTWGLVLLAMPGSSSAPGQPPEWGPHTWQAPYTRLSLFLSGAAVMCPAALEAEC